jgi:hypothetical protein
MAMKCRVLRLAWMLAVPMLGQPVMSVAAEPGPVFDAKGELQRPADYREWIFLTSGIGMNYGPTRPAPGQPQQFTNVFVNPGAYRAFMSTGKWPEKTLFILEVRRGVEHASIDINGRSQGDHLALEAAVKDSTRYPDGGWSYFSFDSREGIKPAAAPLPRTRDCYTCHSRHGAVEWTFTQFYPQQFEVAKRLGTVRPDYDPARKLEQ